MDRKLGVSSGSVTEDGKEAANDFLLIRSVKLFLNNQQQSLPTEAYGYVTWHYTTPSDEIVQLGNN